MLKKTFVITLLLALFSSVYGQTALELFTQGTNAQNREDWYTATELYLEALAINPAYGDAWLALAECSYELDQYELALTYADKASLYIKNRVDIPNLKGFSLIGLGKLEDARNIFLETLIHNPNDIDARFGLAQLDLFNGKFTGAENYFLDALKRESSNKKALVSLALIANEMGHSDKAQDYIKQALRYHNDRADVLYIAGYLAARDNNLSEAEDYIRTAISVNPNYSEAYKLLADILFVQGSYTDAIEICDYIISKERNSPEAWYIKGLSNRNLGNIDTALSAWEVGLSLDAQDEIMRSAFELLVYEQTQIEDPRRKKWAQYHLEKAQIAQEKYLANASLYEYQRTLRIDPLNVESRLALANILLQDGYAESYLSQLQFIQDQGLATRSINDSVESYESMLSNTLPQKWDVDPFYLDKTRWTIALYHFEDSISLFHQDALSITTNMLSDIFNSSQTVSAIPSSNAIRSYAEAFRLSRENGFDFFALVGVVEGERDVRITLDVYLSATGTKAFSLDVYRTGNDRYASALQKIRDDVTSALPNKGTIIGRRGTSLLIDMGRKDGASVEQVYEIYKKDDIALLDSGVGLKYDPLDMLGTITLTEVGEDIAQGVYAQNGFYDLVNIGDEIIPILTQEETETQEGQNSKATPPEGAAPPEVQIENQTSVLYDLINSIR